MGSCISKANSRKRDSTALSTSSESLPAFQQQPVLSPASIIQHEQQQDVTLDQIKKSLNDADERLIQKLRSENEELKMKLAASDEKNKRLEFCEDLIGGLCEKCSLKDEQLAEKKNQLAEKDKQLVEKDAHLADKANLIEFLKAEDVKKNAQLQSKSIEINELQEECGKKDKLLADKEHLIEKLQEKDTEKDVQLQSKSAEIDKLQATCDSKDSKLNEKIQLVEKLQADCIEKDSQMEATLDRLKGLGNSLHDSSKLFDALWNCGLECWDQKLYTEGLVHWQNAIELEKATQNRASKLAELFANKGACYWHLGRDQECIEASNLALKHNPNNADAFNNRGLAYEYLKQYANARQDYEKALQLDPTFELARNNLEKVQELIDASTAQ